MNFLSSAQKQQVFSPGPSPTQVTDMSLLLVIGTTEEHRPQARSKFRGKLRQPGPNLAYDAAHRAGEGAPWAVPAHNQLEGPADLEPFLGFSFLATKRSTEPRCALTSGPATVPCGFPCHPCYSVHTETQRLGLCEGRQFPSRLML